MNTNNKQDLITTILSSMGITLSMHDIYEIISIILLVLSIINILWVLGSRIYTHIKNKEYNKIPQEIEDATNKLKEIEGGDKHGKQ